MHVGLDNVTEDSEAVSVKQFEAEYLQTSGISFNFYYAKIRKKWIAYCFDKKFEDKNFSELLNKITNYIKENRTETNKVNYQFKFRLMRRVK